MIDITLGTLGRPSQFQQTINSLNNLNNSKDVHLYILDGNQDESVSAFLDSNKWNFAGINIYKEHLVIPKSGHGRWPVMYNFLMKKGKSPYVTYWSDDVYPEKDCFELALPHFNKNHKVGAVAFAWQDGKDKPYKIYGTEMHKQIMINFGLLRRTTLERIRYIDEQFNFYNADQDLSLKIWYVNQLVVKEMQCKVTHYAGQKSSNNYRSKERYAEDSRKFASKWSYNAVSSKSVKL